MGVVVVARDASTNTDPHPQPLPTRGRGIHRACGAAIELLAAHYGTYSAARAAPAFARVIVSHTRAGVAGMSM